MKERRFIVQLGVVALMVTGFCFLKWYHEKEVAQTAYKVLELSNRQYDELQLRELVTAIYLARKADVNTQLTNDHIVDYLPYRNALEKNISNQFSDDGYEVFVESKSKKFTITSKGISKERCEHYRDVSKERNVAVVLRLDAVDSGSCKAGNNTILWGGDLSLL